MDILALCTTLSSLDPPWNSTHCLNGQKVSMYLTMVLFICLCLHWKPEYLSYTDMFSQLKRLVSLISTIKWFYWKKYKYKKTKQGKNTTPDYCYFQVHGVWHLALSTRRVSCMYSSSSLWWGGAKLFMCPYRPKVQACPPWVQRPATIMMGYFHIFVEFQQKSW